LILYTSPDCELCDKIKKALREAQIEYEEVTLDTLLQTPEKAAEVFDFSESLSDPIPIFPIVEDSNTLHPPSFALRQVRQRKKRK